LPGIKILIRSIVYQQVGNLPAVDRGPRAVCK